MQKSFRDNEEAQYYTWLYNNFPLHVRASCVWDILEYDYIPGIDRQEVIMTKDKSNHQLLENFWDILWKFHFSNCTISDNYDKICLERGYIDTPTIFIPSKYFFWNIHWDLHFRNIIIQNNTTLVIIDRLLEKWDILWDFPFIMSLLCFWIKENDYKYIEYIKSFFVWYSPHIVWDHNDFFISFRNNFLNYWLVCYEISKTRNDFKERCYWKAISNLLSQETNFLSFIYKL